MFNTPVTREQELLLAQISNREWLDGAFDELQRQYADQWIAILDQRVIANSQEVKDVQQAVGDRDAEAVVMRVPKDPISVPM